MRGHEQGHQEKTAKSLPTVANQLESRSARDTTVCPKCGYGGRPRVRYRPAVVAREPFDEELPTLARPEELQSKCRECGYISAEPVCP